MGHESLESTQEILPENGENEGGLDVIKEGDVESEETVALEVPETPDEGETVDPEFFKGVPEADLEEEE